MNTLQTTLAARAPHDIVIQTAEEKISAQQLLMEMAALQTLLSAMGIDRLGLLADNSAVWITTDLACLAGDVCLLPLPTFFSDAQLLHAIQTTGVDAVLTDDPQRINKIVAAVRVSIEKQPFSELTLMRLRAQQHQALPACTQKITFTSGSTGTPRGVCLSSEQQLRVAESLQITLSLNAPRHLCLLPLSTLLENIGGLYHSLLSGGNVSAPPETERGFSGSTGLDMPRMLQTLVRHRPTSIILLPQMLVGLVAAMEDGWQMPTELRFAAVGGAKVSAELIHRARELGLPVYEGYGLSESGSVACLNHPGNDRIGSVGQPLPHVEVAIEAGEIMLSGNTFLGYVGQADSWGLNTLATDDIGTLDADGFVHLQGRLKNVLISNLGRNISPEWIESEVLLHPEIAQCIVFGDTRPYCCALIATADPEFSDTKIQSLLSGINNTLPDYAHIKKWHRLMAPLTNAEGLYTDNGRPCRSRIADQYSVEIDSLYTDLSSTVSSTVADEEFLFTGTRATAS